MAYLLCFKIYTCLVHMFDDVYTDMAMTSQIADINYQTPSKVPEVKETVAISNNFAANDHDNPISMKFMI